MLFLPNSCFFLVVLTCCFFTGDQTFTDCFDFSELIGKLPDLKAGQQPLWFTFANYSTGDLDGQPIANEGW